MMEVEVYKEKKVHWKRDRDSRHKYQKREKRLEHKEERVNSANFLYSIDLLGLT